MVEMEFRTVTVNREENINPDQILPGQLSSALNFYKTAPERALIAAVLERAMEDARGPARLPGAPHLRAEGAARAIWEARRWFESNADGVMSFVWVCDAMGLEPRRVRAWMEAKCAAPPEVMMKIH
jgi:hypothetical protein